MDQVAGKKKKLDLTVEVAKTLISVGVIAVAVIGFLKLRSMRQSPPNKESNLLIPMVSVCAAEEFKGELDLVVSGSVEPAHEFIISSEVNGKVKQKLSACEAGSYIRGGNTELLVIESQDYNVALQGDQAGLRQAENLIAEANAEIEGSRLNIAASERELRIANSGHQRNLRLLARGVISKSEADQTEQALAAAQSQLTARQNALVGAQKRLESAIAAREISQSRLAQTNLNIGRLVISTDKRGVVVEELVQEGDSVQVGTPLVVLESTEEGVDVLITLSATDLAWIRENNPLDLASLSEEEKIEAAYKIPKVDVDVYETDNPDIVWKGVLERFDGIGRDDLTKTIPCRIRIPEPVMQQGGRPRALVRNTFVKCRIIVNAAENMPEDLPLMFPAAALKPGNYVWTANQQTLDRKRVKVVDYVRDENGQQMVVIRPDPNSIQKGDQVVISPLNQATIGAEARIMDDSRSTDRPGRTNSTASGSKP